MSDEVVRGSDALDLRVQLLHLIRILRVKQLENAAGRDADKRALGRIGVPGPKGLCDVVSVLVLVTLPDRWPKANINVLRPHTGVSR